MLKKVEKEMIILMIENLKTFHSISGYATIMYIHTHDYTLTPSM